MNDNRSEPCSSGNHTTKILRSPISTMTNWRGRPNYRSTEAGVQSTAKGGRLVSFLVLNCNCASIFRTIWLLWCTSREKFDSLFHKLERSGPVLGTRPITTTGLQFQRFLEIGNLFIIEFHFKAKTCMPILKSGRPCTDKHFSAGTCCC